MLDTDQNQFFESVLFESTGIEQSISQMQYMGGGCINNAVKLSTNRNNYFLKWHESAEARPMFEAEAKGLQMLAAVKALRIPEVINTGFTDGKAYLLLNFINSRRKEPDFWQQLGYRLAALHCQTQPFYGLDHTNYIGTLEQHNEPCQLWIEFFVEKRLKVQAGLAYYNQLADSGLLRKLEKLYTQLPELLSPGKPSLLHGDLWSGNVISDEYGLPCLIDPAVYFGHREMEIAFTRLFGGFEPAFYSAYQEASPMEPGYLERFDIYNIYPLLVHVNLFGSSYLSGVEKVLRRYVG
jgi:fructosamine-3-kinase